MRIWKTLIPVVVFAVAVAGCTKVKEATLERGVDLFLANNLEEAAKILEASVALMPENPDAHAWYAECLRRLGRHDEAAAQAYKATELDPDHAFGHTVLADLFSPQYSKWPRTDADSAWFHLRKAIDSDPQDGNAWPLMWVQSMQRGEGHMERRAAEKMIDSGFLTTPLLAYNRWQLSYLPENAILLTNGDMDTYPAVALQHKDGLRPDVAVVNVSLLSLDWYGSLLADRYGIRMPGAVDETVQLSPYRDDQGRIVPTGTQIVRHWIEMQAVGDLERPLCAAVTVADFHFTPDIGDRMVLCGPYYEIMPSAVEDKEDLDRLATTLGTINPADFEGPFVSAMDRSPVRRAATDKIASNITAAMLRYATALAEDERWAEAADVLGKAEVYDSSILAAGQFTAEMDSLRLKVDKHAGP
jgi:tetratricopeptide (TPR) repeat protein